MILKYFDVRIIFMQFPFASQVSLSVAKISFDATPGLVGDIKQLLIKLLLPPSVYVKPCITLTASESF